jgi:hypothetical protein
MKKSISTPALGSLVGSGSSVGSPDRIAQRMRQARQGRPRPHHSTHACPLVVPDRLLPPGCVPTSSPVALLTLAEFDSRYRCGAALASGTFGTVLECSPVGPSGTGGDGAGGAGGGSGGGSGGGGGAGGDGAVVPVTSAAVGDDPRVAPGPVEVVEAGPHDPSGRGIGPSWDVCGRAGDGVADAPLVVKVINKAQCATVGCARQGLLPRDRWRQLMDEVRALGATEAALPSGWLLELIVCVWVPVRVRGLYERMSVFHACLL